MPILFCNTSWMKNYAGRSVKDPPLGGGGFPTSEGYCGEECNFVSCDDGFVYGHFEISKNGRDRQEMARLIEALDKATAEFARRRMSASINAALKDKSVSDFA